MASSVLLQPRRELANPIPDLFDVAIPGIYRVGFVMVIRPFKHQGGACPEG